MEYCQTCCSGRTKDLIVDYLLSSTYGEIDLDEDPCIVPACGHLMTMSSMDGCFALGDYYDVMSNGEILALKGASSPFSIDGLKSCPICRGSLRNINRYSRIVRRSAIDEATKKFISWSNAEIIKHADALQNIQIHFAADQDVARVLDYGEQRRAVDIALGEQSDTVKLQGHRNQVMADISRIKGLKARYKGPFHARQRLSMFLHKIKEEEQPFGRLWDLVQDRRRRDRLGRLNSDLVYEPSVLQLRAYLMSMSLSIKFDITIIADALSIRKKMTGLAARYDWAAVDLEVDFSHLRNECLALGDLLASHQQHRLEIETRLSCAHLGAIERAAVAGLMQTDRFNDLRELGLEQVNKARQIHEQFPGQTTGVDEELEAVELMLNDGTFYNVVTSEEKRAVYAAMSQHFSGTGHWYTCANGHPFTVGECGMPMEQASCPQCGSPIGGQRHQAAEGVQHINDLEAAMGNLEVGDGV